MSDAEPEIRVEVTLRNRYGLHARPATLIAQTAKDFQCQVWLAKDATEVDAKSIFGMLTLAAEAGTVLTLRARGADAEQAVDRLRAVITGFEVDD